VAVAEAIKQLLRNVVGGQDAAAEGVVDVVIDVGDVVGL
jgi:hypothetical protein